MLALFAGEVYQHGERSQRLDVSIPMYSARIIVSRVVIMSTIVLYTIAPTDVSDFDGHLGKGATK